MSLLSLIYSFDIFCLCDQYLLNLITKNMMIQYLSRLVFITICMLHCNSYKQLQIIRSPLITTTSQFEQNNHKITEQHALNTLSCSVATNNIKHKYTEICYQKDIAYNLQFYMNQQVYYVAVDFTIPISWLKSNHCKNMQGDCSMIKDTRKDEIKKLYKDVNSKLKVFDQNTVDQKKIAFTLNAQSTGSTDKIQGLIEEVQDLQIYARDSEEMNKLGKLILLSAFISHEKQRIQLKKTTFIKSYKLTQTLNTLTDGAISFKFNSESQNSILNQIFQGISSKDRIITIYLGPLAGNGVLSIGDISQKYMKTSKDSIQWIALQSSSAHDQIAKTTGLQIIALDASKQLKKQMFNQQIDVVFTLSSSFLTFPSKFIKYLIHQIHKVTQLKCYQNVNKYLQCETTSRDLMTKLQFIEISVHFEDKIHLNIKLSELFYEVTQQVIIFKIKQSIMDNLVILSQPIFIKYTLIFDYQQNKIGFINKYHNRRDKFVSLLVYFFRAFFFLAFMLLIIVICYKPITKLVKAISKYPLTSKRKSYNQVKNKSENQFDYENKKKNSLFYEAGEGINLN